MALLTGCATGSRVLVAARSAVYERARVQFDQTLLCKPEEAEGVEHQRAPLLVQEVTGMTVRPRAPAVVYYWRTEARGLGQDLEQLNFVWSCPGGEQALEVWQGVRITFNAQGSPILWEVLRDSSGARVLFVGQSVEAAAMVTYPAPLPERRFWVERGVAEAPAVVVARILDDAPAVMGPIVYLRSEFREVVTLICRCMDAQAREVVELRTYRLVRLDGTSARELFRRRSCGVERWLPGRPPDDLDRLLRTGSLGTNAR